jgi:hypothetical protein
MLFGVHPFAQHLFKTMSSDKPVWLQTEFARSYIYHSVTPLPSCSINYSHTFFEYVLFHLQSLLFCVWFMAAGCMKLLNQILFSLYLRCYACRLVATLLRTIPFAKDNTILQSYNNGWSSSLLCMCNFRLICPNWLNICNIICHG